MQSDPTCTQDHVFLDYISVFCTQTFSAHIFIFCMLMQFLLPLLFPHSALAFPNVAVTPVSHCKRKQGVFFSAPMLTAESVHTARRGGAAARSRSRAGAAVPRSFRRRVYFCCAAYAQLK